MLLLHLRVSGGRGGRGAAAGRRGGDAVQGGGGGGRTRGRAVVWSLGLGLVLGAGGHRDGRGDQVTVARGQTSTSTVATATDATTTGAVLAQMRRLLLLLA